MEVVTGAMSTLLPKLGKLLREEYKMQKGVRGQVMFLKAELESMEAALHKVSDASIDQPPDIQVKLWAREVRELSYDIEDRVDTFMVRMDHAPKELHGLRGFIERSLELLTKARIRHKLGTDIKDLRSSIEEVSKRRDRYKVDQVSLSPAGMTVDDLRLSALYKKATELIGTEKKSSELIEWLMEGDEASKKQLRIVSIAGFGGLGKTTLAKVVYDKLKRQFDCGAFVSVSYSPNVERIFINMLKQLGGRSIEATCGRQQLIDELRKFLQDKRYFIVVDDIWDTSVWEIIQYALIDSECGSKVISTTRNLDVAKKVGGVYKLQPLSHADSRKLFCLRIFGTEETCIPNELAEVSEIILKKCGGVPLAIITIASMLANGKENTRKSWFKVCQMLGSGLEDNPDVIKMRRILSISYYDLPPHLKTCMLYLSSYPEDASIWTKELIQKWAGEGFIIKRQGMSFHEVGEHYVAELINRSMIEPFYVYHDGNKEAYFRVHDMVLDLITHLSEEDGFLTTVDGQRPIHFPHKIRRLSIKTSNKEDVKQLSTVGLDHVRSLCVSEEAFIPSLLTSPVLRLLDLHGCRQVDNHYFRVICYLFHLRYLRMSYTSITEIPKEIGNLQYLQILDMSGTEVEELPSTFVHLRQLLYLHVDNLTRTPDGFGNLKHLQELDGIIIIEAPTMIHNLTGLTKLTRMDLQFHEWNEHYEQIFLQYLGSLVNLKYLKLAGCNGGFGSRCERLMPGPQLLQNIKMKSNTWFSVPRWMSSLCALTTLHISLLTLGDEDLHVLGSIPSLSHLQLSVEESTPDRGKKFIIDNTYPFLCLTKLEICITTGVMFAQGAMPKLQTLVLVFGVLETLDKFGDFDFGLENLSSLVHVDASMGCSKAKSENLKAAEDSIRNALDMNPNKPTLNCQETHWLKVHIHYEGFRSNIMEILDKIDGVYEKNIDPKQKKVTVCIEDVKPIPTMEKLNKAGILAQVLSYTYLGAGEEPLTCSVM